MAEAKLTKKQRKSLDFRSKGKGEQGDKTGESGADGQVSSEAAARVDKGKGKDEGATDASPSPAKEAAAASTAKPSSKKRKGTDDEAARTKPTKKRFTEDGQAIEVAASESAPAAPSAAEQADTGNKRFIVFVGNMSYKTTSAEIVKHFHSHCGEQPSVRLLTTKADPQKLAGLSKSKQKSIAKGKSTGGAAASGAVERSKGCAFVEFTSRQALQKALQFHHTALQGRTINVELTAGGGGKGAERKQKIEKKNRELEAERKKLHEKYVKTAAGSSAKAKKDGAPAEQEPSKPHWGPNAEKSSQHAKGGAPRKIPKWAASGANAVRLNG